MTSPSTGGGDDDPGRRNFVNLVALGAVLALLILGYWAFNALEHSWKLQRCLDSGRRDCVDTVSPHK